jgi:hypothetical protein
LKWVWHIMSQYHAARSAPTPAMRRKGRRFYPCWRPPAVIRTPRSARPHRACR